MDLHDEKHDELQSIDAQIPAESDCPSLETQPEANPESHLTPHAPDEQKVLSAEAVRVLGSLIEKAETTPEYYPLSLNALQNACNQKSNREPVMELDEDAVRLSLRQLEDRGLAGRARSSEGRVSKYEHWIGEAFNLTRAETALFCVLLLRGPQTPGELRSRAERMHRFDEIADVTNTLDKLIARNLVVQMARQRGTKEARYAHLLAGPVLIATAVAPPVASPTSTVALGGDAEARIAALEARLADLERRFNDLYA